jgi:hypothetical protein
MTIDDYVEAIGLPSGGAVRAFASEFVNLTSVPDDLPPRSGC